MIEDFIDDRKIEDILEKATNPPRERVLELIAKSKELKGLTPEETAVLLQTEDRELIEEIWKAARDIKEAIYGNRLVIFAPCISQIIAPITVSTAVSGKTTRNLHE